MQIDMVNIMSPQDWLVFNAKSYLDVPFLHAGRNKFGVDCIGLVICAARDAGLVGDYDNTNYSSVVNAGFFRSEIEKFCCCIDKDLLDVGDLLLFSMRGTASTTTHVGLYIGLNQFIHSDQGLGRVVIQQLRGAWSTRLVSVYRWKQWQL